VRDDIRWEPHRPRELLAWLKRHDVSAAIGIRAVICTLTGFRDDSRERQRRNAPGDRRAAFRSGSRRAR
jgi:hypothetical protein